MANILFFFTSSYPFGAGETFIENEIDYLSGAFEKVIIISNDTENEQTRDVPKNVTLVRKGYELSKWQKLLAAKTIFSPEFWKELKILHTVYKRTLNTLILNTILQSWHKALRWQPVIKKLVNKYSQAQDRVCLYSYWNNDMALALAQYRRMHNDIKAVTRMHRWDIYFEENKVNYLPFRTFIFKNLNKIFSISEQGKDYYNKWHRKFQNQIGVSRLGVKARKPNTLFENSEMHLLTISNMIPVKNLDTLIDALALLNINFHWTHIGDGHLRPELEEKAKNKIPESYTFKGRISNNEVLQYMETQPIDLFINVSLSEGIPVSIMEAFSCGIPAMATDVGGNSEIVTHKKNGFIIQTPTDTHEIANTIKQFATMHPESKIAFRAAAHQTWKEQYNTEKNYKAWVEKLLSL